jgi:hypothetical protein
MSAQHSTPPSAPPISNSLTPVPQQPAKHETVSGDLEPFLKYLDGERGHEIASRLIAVIEAVKHATLDKSATNARVEKYIQAALILAVIVATSILVAIGKFEASVGVLFGTLIGYAFGKK